MRILGIEIESKTDILAASAFVLSLGGLAAQLANILRGPHIVVEGPRQVLIHSKEYSPGESYTTLSSETTYVNVGSPGFSDILKSESASLRINDKQLNFISSLFIDAEADAGKLSIKKDSSWRPIKLDAGDVSTKTTLYVPEPGRDGNASSFIEPTEFIALLAKNKPSSTIQFRQYMTTFKNQLLVYTCDLRIGDFYFALAEKGWSAPLCRNGKVQNTNPIGDFLDRMITYASR